MRKGVFKFVHNSKWNSRGWILQERLLNCRILHFADEKHFIEWLLCLTGENMANISDYTQKRWASTRPHLSIRTETCVFS